MLAILTAIAGCSTQFPGPVAVLVEVPRPAGATHETIDAGFREALSAFERVPGLQRKYFTRTDTDIGGVYLWDSVASAQAFFDEAWTTRVRCAYGSEPRLTYFDAPVSTPGGGEGSAGADSVVSIVRVTAPWYAPRALITSRMEDSVPRYAEIPGLDFKVYTIASGKQVGGIYLWAHARSAQAFYDAAWHQRIRETYEEDADIAYFHTPVQLTER